MNRKVPAALWVLSGLGLMVVLFHDRGPDTDFFDPILWITHPVQIAETLAVVALLGIGLPVLVVLFAAVVELVGRGWTWLIGRR